MRSVIRSLAYAGGALRLRHAATLTVLMFHRVVPRGTPADPVYSLSPELFAACLGFFRRHYAVVSLDDVLASHGGERMLPPRALLLTFDDGWRDTWEVAAPLLQAAGMPGVVFVAADALADPGPWWQEVLLRALRERQASLSELWEAAGPATPPEAPPELSLLRRYAALDAALRARLLARYLPGVAGAMLRPEALPALAAAGLAVGGHGAAHMPLTLVDARADLARCRAMLGAGPVALSFPHGRYDAQAVAAAHEAGFKLLFTSDAYLNPVMNGRAGCLLGRISVQAEHIVQGDRLDPARLATWLFHRGLGPAAPAGPGQGPGLA